MTDTRLVGKEASPVADKIDFYAHTGHLQLAKSPITGEPSMDMLRVYGVGATALQDLDGDFMTESALRDMTTLPEGRVCFLNHEWVIPEGGFGQIAVSPSYAIHTAQEDTFFVRAGEEYGVVEIGIDVFEDEPRAQRVLKWIAGKGARRPAKIGISVGCQVFDYDVMVDGDGYASGFIVKRTIPLEFSTVGIPSNQAAWVTDAVLGKSTVGISRSAGQSWPAEAARGISKRYGELGAVLPDDPDQARYMILNWRDFATEDQVWLRRFDGEDLAWLTRTGEILDKYDMAIVRHLSLTGEAHG